MMNSNHVLLHLSLIDGIGAATIHKKIIARKPNECEWQDLYLYTVHDWMQLGIPAAFAQRICKGLQNKKLLEDELAVIEKQRVSWITIFDDTYPVILREIYLPPSVLYFKGAPLDQGRRIAFVGSRQANRYGKLVIDSLIPELVAHNITIVSGGAIGADSMAHQATIDAKGKTIVVLGSGILNLYPYRNKKLFEEIIAGGGTILSIFPMQTEPWPGNFAARNRVIAGLTDGVVVVQAAQKSGTRITAQFALEQGRDVFAVPGPLNDPLSAGCHALIQEGAKLICDGSDILQEYGIALVKQEKSCQVKEVMTKAPTIKIHKPGTIVEEQILTVCGQAQSIDEIAAKTGKNLSDLQLILFEMQMAGSLDQNFTGLWHTV